ncbi:MAG: type II toxin-antitoxin system HipA family toxin [Pseudomonadota bacterium]
MKRVDVYYEGWGERWILGTLAHGNGELLFEYSAQALAQKLELSPLKLPLQAAAFSRFPQALQGLPGLIADSLPDGWGLLLMDRCFRKYGVEVSRVSPLDRLMFLGHRTMGALTFEPSQAPADTTGAVDLLQLAQQAHQVMNGKDSKLLAELVLLGGSPHGARPKVLVDYCAATGEMGTQGVRNGHPWLVKFQSQGEHKEVCAIENCYAALARDCGLDMPATQYFDISPGLGGFGIARFDVENGMRVPVHTLAGAMNADFRLPGTLDYLTFLRVTRNLTRDEREVENGFARAVFNVVFNNRDDHPKNFSFRLNSERHWKLSPAYDLTYSPGPGGHHQMDVMGESQAITRKDMLELATRADIPAGKAVAHLDRHLAVAGGYARTLKAAKVRPATIKDLAARVTANLKRLK